MKKTDIAILRFVEDYHKKTVPEEFIDIKIKLKIEAIFSKQKINTLLTLSKMRELLRPAEIKKLKMFYETIQGKQITINYKN